MIDYKINKKQLITRIKFIKHVFLIAFTIRFLPVLCQTSNYQETESNGKNKFEIRQSQMLISNMSDSIITFLVEPNFNNYKYGDINEMIKSIYNDSMCDEKKVKLLWIFVIVSGDNGDFDIQHNLNDNTHPLALVRYPQFMCGEKAGILANLAVYAGFKSRRIALKGHEVCEIFYDNEWHMFDASFNCFFYKEDGTVASIEYLVDNISKISKNSINILIPIAQTPYIRLLSHINRNYLFNSYINKFLIGYSKESIRKPNFLSKMQMDNQNMHIKLYPNDTISFKLIKKKSKLKQIILPTRIKNISQAIL